MFCCGCEVRPGEPISPQVIRAHYKHTMEVLLLWELIHRPGQDMMPEKLKLAEARIELLEAITKLYPEAQED